VYLFAVLLLVASFFVPGADEPAGPCIRRRRFLTVPGATWGIILMLVSLAFFIIVSRWAPELRGHRAAGAHARHDDDAFALTIWGIFMATVLALLAFPRSSSARS